MVEYLQNIFRSNSNSEIKQLYNQYLREFAIYIKKRFDIDEDTIFDIYQETFISLYENIQNKKLNTLTSSIKTYIFSIGIRKTYKYLEKEKPFDKIEMYDHLYYGDDESTEWEEIQRIAYQTVKNMQEPCNTVLTLFYWKGNSMKEIAARMNYKNEMVAKNRKSLCLKTVKELIKQKIERLKQ